MKKSIITTFLLVFTNLLFANEYEIKKVHEFSMGNYQQGLYLRKYEEVAPHKLADKQAHPLLHRKHLGSAVARAVVQRTFYKIVMTYKMR